ncbi:MAG: amidohydrolase [Pirellulales bacterium]
MTERADAHIHLFEGGYQGGSFAHRPGVTLDEAQLYESLAKEHAVHTALVVCYEGQRWAAGNNDHVGALTSQHAWIRPVAFVDPAHPPSIGQLQQWQANRFVGISLYILTQEDVDAVGSVPDSIWSWIADHRWLVSVNSRGAMWSAWPAILRRHEGLRIVLSHVGLPPAVDTAPSPADAARNLRDVIALARFPGPRVKLSGFYALTQPRYDYPHRNAWPYVETLLTSYGSQRLVWGSDFSPSLDAVTFPQTLGLFSKMPFLSPADRQAIEGGNLLALVDETVS